MIKPTSLRQYLLSAMPRLGHNPEQLQVFINNGKIAASLPGSLSFEYNYRLQLLLTDFAEHPNTLIVPLLAWLKLNQPDLDPNSINFEAEILRNDLVDLSISLPLSERVIVTTNQDGNYLTDHAAEPQLEESLPDPGTFTELHQDNGTTDINLTPPQP